MCMAVPQFGLNDNRVLYSLYNLFTSPGEVDEKINENFISEIRSHSLPLNFSTFLDLLCHLEQNLQLSQKLYIIKVEEYTQ